VFSSPFADEHCAQEDKTDFIYTEMHGSR
jgi:hypothetical protein